MRRKRTHDMIQLNQINNNNIHIFPLTTCSVTVTELHSDIAAHEEESVPTIPTEELMWARVPPKVARRLPNGETVGKTLNKANIKNATSTAWSSTDPPTRKEPTLHPDPSPPSKTRHNGSPPRQPTPKTAQKYKAKPQLKILRLVSVNNIDTEATCSREPERKTKRERKKKRKRKKRRKKNRLIQKWLTNHRTRAARTKIGHDRHSTSNPRSNPNQQDNGDNVTSTPSFNT